MKKTPRESKAVEDNLSGDGQIVAYSQDLPLPFRAICDVLRKQAILDFSERALAPEAGILEAAPNSAALIRLLRRLGYIPITSSWPPLLSYESGDLVFVLR